MMQVIEASKLNQRFGIPGVAEIVEGNGGLTKVRVKSAAVEGEIYLQGAHLTSWKPASAEEIIFMSRQSRFESGIAIRGGVPICFPWFGANANNPKAPAHGFARSRPWELESVEKNGDAVSVTMSLVSDEDTKKWLPTTFRLLFRATFGPELAMELILTNTGESPLRFEEALHTYYRIGDISKTQLVGLDGVHYLDKTDSNQEKIQHGDIVIGAEMDSVYLNTTGTIEIVDPVLRRRIYVAKENSGNTVVWNPWLQKAQAMADLGETSWPNMVCVEACNVGANAPEVAPGKQHSMKAITRVTAL
jgi:glucose-6-phosphate 1-epimerase